MIPVIEVNSGQSFESKKFAAEYFRISINLVNHSLKTGETVGYSKPGYLFKNRGEIRDGKTNSVSKPIENFPFGKYKGKKIALATDAPYLMWFVSLNINDRLKKVVSRRIQELKEKK